MIQLSHVSKHYIDGKKIITAIDDVSLSFSEGEFVAISGESGSGKSTLLNILSGADYLTNGEYLINGIDTDGFDEKDWSDFRCQNIALIYQDYKLIENYTVSDNIRAVLNLIKLEKNECEEILSEVLEKTSIKDLANKKVKFLSGGQKQRVAIARALAKGSDIILADEPTANLDEKNASEIINLLGQISADKLIIVVSHNAEQFSKVLTRKITLSDGRIIKDEKVFQNVNKGILKTKNNALIERNNSNYKFGLFKNLKPIFSIFITVLFVLASSLSLLSVGIDMTNDKGEGLIETKFFANLSKDRYIISKFDKTAFTEAEIAAFSAKNGIKSIVKEDLVLDTIAYTQNPFTKNEIQSNIRPISDIKKVDCGRLPQSEDELVLSTESGMPLYMMEDESEYHSFRIDSDEKEYRIKVVGWVKNSTNYRSSVYITDGLFKKLYVEKYLNVSNANLKNESETKAPERLITDENVPKGKLYSNNAELIGKSFSLEISNAMTKLSTQSFTVEDVKNNLDLSSNYNFDEKFVLINYSDCQNLLLNNIMQISVFSDNAIEPWDNYNVIYPYAINFTQHNNGNQVVLTLIWFLLVGIVSSALIFVSFSFLKKILKNEVDSNRIKMLLGYSKTDLKNFICCRLGLPLGISFLLISMLYAIIKIYYKKNILEIQFLLLSNLTVFEFMLSAILICVLFAIVLSVFLVKHSNVDFSAIKRRKSND